MEPFFKVIGPVYHASSERGQHQPDSKFAKLDKSD